MTKSKRKKIHAVNGEMFQRRVIIAFAAVILAFVGLGFRLGWIQVVKTDVYAAKAEETQMKEQIISARRGAILDRNMKELAISTGSYEVFVRLKPYGNTKPDPEKQQKQRTAAAELLSSVLEIAPEEMAQKLSSEDTRVRIAKDVDKNKMGLIRQVIGEKGINIIEIEENVKREYPMGSFASHVLGFVGRDGAGLEGIELQYNDYLSGKAGRRIVSTDRAGNPLTGGNTTIATDGSGVVLTIDETIQYYVENEIEKTYRDVKADNMQAIVMDPKTGDILAMAAYPDYDPNDYGKPVDSEQVKQFATMEAEAQSALMTSLWRNLLVTDRYEPGSVFKLVTVSSGIEEGAVTPQSQFSCSGSYAVGGQNIHCWNYPSAHGTQTVKQAVGNSCNPVMMQIVQKMGYDRFANYLELFGITAPTGIDYPGEAEPDIQSKEKAGAVGLATMSFGHGLSVTPVQMSSAVSAVVNGGNLMQPRLVKALADEDGTITKEFDPVIVRKVISKQTSDEMKDIMEYAVEDAGAKVAKIPGYRIGAKTGTAQMVVNGRYSASHVVGSMVAAAPMDDPQIIVLVVATNPKVGEFGSTTAGPAVKSIMEKILRYKSIKPTEKVG